MKVIFALLVISAELAMGQQPIKTIRLSGDVVAATVDRPGDVYIQTSDGKIEKFDTDGQLISSLKGNIPDLFDPRDGARLFGYFSKDAHYTYYNPSFEEVANYKIDSSFVIEPMLACSSGDHDIWVIDAADKSLRKINVRNSRIDVEVILSSIDRITDIIYMREYQGFVFLLHKSKGISVYSGMGRFLISLGNASTTFFNFLGEELYYPESGKLKYFNLFSAEKHESTLPPEQRFVLITDQRQYRVGKRILDVLPLTK